MSLSADYKLISFDFFIIHLTQFCWQSFEIHFLFSFLFLFILFSFSNFLEFCIPFCEKTIFLVAMTTLYNNSILFKIKNDNILNAHILLFFTNIFDLFFLIKFSNKALKLWFFSFLLTACFSSFLFAYSFLPFLSFSVFFCCFFSPRLTFVNHAEAIKRLNRAIMMI